MNRKLLPAALALTALAATAASPVGAQPSHPTEVAIEVHEWEGGAMHLYPIRVNAQVGETVTFIVTNPDVNEQPHNIVMCGEPVDPNNLPPSSECSDKWGFTPNFPPGETREFTFVAEKAGTFEYYCDILGHKTATPGMRGLLVVHGGAAEQKDSPSLGALAALGALALVALALGRR